MGDYTPVYQPGATRTYTASAAVTGGQVVEITGAGTVGPSAAGSAKVVGVAAHDAGIGARVTVHGLAGQEHEVTASGAITAGDLVEAAAAGQVRVQAAAGAAYVQAEANAHRALLGVATTTAANGAKVRFVGR